MDLAEIRKKARSGKENNVKADSPFFPSVQGMPRARGTTEPLPPTSAGQIIDGQKDEDSLESLFTCRSGIDMATEESYQQTLRGQEQNSVEELRQWLAFTLGNEEYALDIGSICEIIKPKEVTDIPRVPDFILGIISLRGVIVPVFDLKKRFKLGAVELSAASRVVVCQQDDRSAGLLVDSITQVVHVPAEKIEPPPAVLSGLDRDLIEGVGRYQGRIIILLHLPSVLNAELI
jgi:purine-binding chemotaxis protein CheW